MPSNFSPPPASGPNVPSVQHEPQERQHRQPAESAGVGKRRQRMNPILSTPVGAELHGAVITQADIDIEKQILDCSHQAMRCEKLGRMEQAVSWSEAMQAAIAARRPEIVAAWEAHEREWLDSLTETPT